MKIAVIVLSVAAGGFTFFFVRGFIREMRDDPDRRIVLKMARESLRRRHDDPVS